MKIRILIISPSLNVGGIARRLTLFADHFAEMGHEVFFISCINIKQFYSLSKEVTLIKASYKRNKRFSNKIFFRLWLVLYLRRKIREIRPDVVLVFGETFNPLVLLASWNLKVPVFIGDNTSPDYNYGLINRILKKLTYRSSAGIICQTKYAEAFKKRQYGSMVNTFVLDNPIRGIKNYDTVRQNIILFVGRFAWEKAPEKLIRAFALMDNQKKWKLVMAGDGPLLEKSKTLVSELGLTRQVDFLGRVENVDRLFFEAGIFVLPSVIEGFPNALAEAMIAGLPVICFDSFPSDEIVTNDVDGIIISGGSEEMLAHELDRLANDENERKRLGTNAAKIRKRLDPNTIAEKLLDYMFKTISDQA
jgi:glycosyltransferase involved in cell wall biosynthesis